jgi:hypothetical protein
MALHNERTDVFSRKAAARNAGWLARRLQKKPTPMIVPLHPRVPTVVPRADHKPRMYPRSEQYRCGEDRVVVAVADPFGERPRGRTPEIAVVRILLIGDASYLTTDESNDGPSSPGRLSAKCQAEPSNLVGANKVSPGRALRCETRDDAIFARRVQHVPMVALAASPAELRGRPATYDFSELIHANSSDASNLSDRRKPEGSTQVVGPNAHEPTDANDASDLLALDHRVDRLARLAEKRGGLVDGEKFLLFVHENALARETDCPTPRPYFGVRVLASAAST